MSLKQYLEDAMVHELSVVQHLIKKLPESAWDFHPKENMRSTVELLQYLSYISETSLGAYVKGGWMPENIPPMREIRDKKLNLGRSDFHDELEGQKHKVREILAPITDADLMTMKTLHPWGTEVILFEALINATLKYLAAYKMQLFLYAKMNGAEINTANGWRGVDPPPPKA
jgi:hypothetical protein